MQIIGASLSEPPPGRVNGCSFYMYLYIWYVRHSVYLRVSISTRSL